MNKSIFCALLLLTEVQVCRADCTDSCESANQRVQTQCDQVLKQVQNDATGTLIGASLGGIFAARGGNTAGAQRAQDMLGDSSSKLSDAIQANEDCKAGADANKDVCLQRCTPPAN